MFWNDSFPLVNEVCCEVDREGVRDGGDTNNAGASQPNQ